MIRTTYLGREVKILAARRTGEHRVVINGHTVHQGLTGSEVSALDWVRTVLDRIDARGPGGNPSHTSPFWYAPGSFRLNGFGHAIALDGAGCVCDLCLMNPQKNVPAEDVAA